MINKGQSLLEIVITLGLLAIIGGALAITTINGLKSSEYSKNQSQATKYAQELLEQVRTIIDRDYLICPTASNCAFVSTIWTANYFGTFSNCGTSHCYKVDSGASCTIPSPVSTSPICLVKITSEETLTGTIFKRNLIFEDIAGNPDQKKVTAKVLWTDITGSHNSELVTFITNK